MALTTRLGAAARHPVEALAVLGLGVSPLAEGDDEAGAAGDQQDDGGEHERGRP